MNDIIPDIDVCLKAEEEQLESKEYSLSKENINYNIKVGKTKSKIVLSCIHYEYKSNLEKLISFIVWQPLNIHQAELSELFHSNLIMLSGILIFT